MHVDPVLLDAAELPLGFTWAQVPYRYSRGELTRVRVLSATGWVECPGRSFDPQGVLAVEAEVAC